MKPFFLAEIGQALLYTTVIVALIGIVGSRYFLKRSSLVGFAFARINLGFLCGSLLGCLGLLFAGFIKTDLSLKTVAINSSNLEPLIYKIAALWSNHEGSLLLWNVTLCLFGFSFALFPTPGLSRRQKTHMLMWFHAVLFGFLVFMTWLSNPFELMSVVPHKGLGMNPLLHDPSMTFHPPTLYFGYIGFIVPFIIAMGLMGTRALTADTLYTLSLWTYIPWVFLTFGITAGALWAYYELGWGGYWAWDPVENASLLPWLSSTAALHMYTRSKYKGCASKSQILWVLGLSAVSWLLSLLGTYITRSGVVASIHGFAQDEQRGLFLLGFLCVLVILTSLGLIRTAITNREVQTPTSLPSKSIFFNRSTLLMMMVVGAVSIVIFLIVATLAPVFLGGTITESFYNLYLVPMALLMLGLMGLVNLVTWAGVTSLWQRFKDHVIAVNIGLLVMILILYDDEFTANIWSIYGCLGSGLSAMLMASTAQVWTQKKRHIMSLAHIGFAVVILGVSLNTLYKDDQHIWLTVGESGFVGKYEFLYKGVTQTTGRHYDFEEAQIDVINFAGETIATLAPQTRLYHAQNVLTSKTSIQMRYYAHLYAILGPQMSTGERSIRILYQPFVDLIWGGGLLITLAGIFALCRRRNSAAKIGA